MERDKEYYAFISYKSEDSEWAIWLQHELEHYRLPASFNGRSDIRQELRPVFRDIDELSAGNLPEQIRQALENSLNLIVVCSPQAAASPWVNQEIETFISLGRIEHIFPFIVEGNSPNEFFPPALLNLPKSEERLGGDVCKNGKDAAFIKIVSGMLGVRFDSLWQRYEKEKAENERREREKRDNLYRLQSRFIAEKAKTVATYDSYLARRLAVEALPEVIDNPDRPYIPEADAALRLSSYQSNTILRGHTKPVNSAVYSSDGKRILSISTDMIKVWDVETGINIYTIEESSHGADFYQDSEHIITISGFLADTKMTIHNLDTGEIKSINGFQNFLGFKCTFSPNSTYVVTDMDALWDITKGELLKNLIGDEYTTVGSERYFSPDSTLIASCSNHQVWINNVYGDDYIVLPEEHTDNVSAVSFSPREKKLVSASWDKTLKIWDIETKSVLITLKGHLERVFAVVYSLDGKRIASGDEGGVIIIWNSETGEVIKQIEGHTKSISSLHFSPDGNHIVSSSDDKTVRLWDLKDHTEFRQYNNTHTFNTLFDPVAANPVEKTIAYSFDNCLVVWNLETKSISRAFYAPEGIINSIAFSYDGKEIITTSGKALLLWNLKTNKLIHTYRGHHDEVFFVSFSPDGKRVVSTSADKTLKIWELGSGDCVITKEVKAWMAMFSPDGHYLAYNTFDGDIIICDSDTCEVLRQISVASPKKIFSFCFSPRGDAIASSSGDGIVSQWDVKTGHCINHYTDFAPKSNLSGPISYSRDGKKISFVSGDNKIKILVSDSMTLVSGINDGSEEQKENYIGGSEESGNRNRISCAAFSCVEDTIITSSSDRIVITDLSRKAILHIIDKPHYLSRIEKIAFHSDKKLIAIVYSEINNLVIVKDYPMGLIVQLLMGHSQSINSLDFNKNGSRIVSTSDDGTVRIWDLDSGRDIACLESDCELFDSATFSPNETEIVAISRYNLDLFFRDLNESPFIHRNSNILKIDENIITVEKKGKTLELTGHNGRVNSAFLSPDSNYVISASSDKEIKVWNISDGELMQTLKGHHGPVNYAAYSSDGKYIISASDDSTVKLWNAQNGLLLKTFSCNKSPIITVAISTDNRKIVAASTDRVIILWDVQDDSRVKLFYHCSENQIVKLYFSIDCKYIGIHEGLGFRIIDMANGEKSLLPIVRIWNYINNTVVLNNYSHLKKINSVRYNADGRKVVTASDDAIIRVLDSVTCQLTMMIKMEKQVGVKFVCFDRYGKNAISVDDDKRLSIWSLDTGKMISNIDSVSGLYCISPDGRYISYIEEDRRVVICDIETNTTLQSIENPQYGYDSMTFSYNGNAIILTRYSDVYIWEFPPLQQLINDTRERFKNNPLTQEERKHFYLE